ncbi:unnamed protein product [Moneuplotes crassus]|uniref:Uncharacterized protein n=1 Tax=Euplotes crassus TaxID=5936 RepID=A0AAD1XD41_EUPCR|nr:unnamed protein product [Moneuplotes crassus]
MFANCVDSIKNLFVCGQNEDLSSQKALSRRSTAVFKKYKTVRILKREENKDSSLSESQDAMFVERQVEEIKSPKFGSRRLGLNLVHKVAQQSGEESVDISLEPKVVAQNENEITDETQAKIIECMLKLQQENRELKNLCKQTLCNKNRLIEDNCRRIQSLESKLDQTFQATEDKQDARDIKMCELLLEMEQRISGRIERESESNAGIKSLLSKLDHKNEKRFTNLEAKIKERQGLSPEISLGASSSNRTTFIKPLKESKSLHTNCEQLSPGSNKMFFSKDLLQKHHNQSKEVSKNYDELVPFHPDSEEQDADVRGQVVNPPGYKGITESDLTPPLSYFRFRK